MRAVESLTTGPAAILGRRFVDRPVGLVEGARADLVVFDRSETWTVSPESLMSKGKNSPFIGRTLPGRVLATISDGTVAWSGD
jgi:dihydroorotase